jgi:hypothetical protein
MLISQLQEGPVSSAAEIYVPDANELNLALQKVVHFLMVTFSLGPVYSSFVRGGGPSILPVVPRMAHLV